MIIVRADTNTQLFRTLRDSLKTMLFNYLNIQNEKIKNIYNNITFYNSI